MWLATKYAARKRVQRDPDESGPRIPPMHVRQTQLGLDGAIEYRQLFEKHPEIELGPDETLDHHLSRLRVAEKEHLNESGARPETQVNPFTREVSTPVPEWLQQRQQELQRPPVTAPSGLAQRIPGQWVGPTEMGGMPPRSFIPGGGDLPKRQPGRYTAPVGYSPGAGPQPQSRDEWMRGLADKGIYLNGDGSRMTPEQMALPRRSGPPAPRGHDIWADLIDQPRPGRHRAAKAVVAYIAGLPDDLKIIDAISWSES